MYIDQSDKEVMFNPVDKTFRFIYSTYCLPEYYRCVDNLRIPIVNNSQLIIGSLDCITDILTSDEFELYICIDDCIGLNNLYKVVDSPQVRYNTLTNKAEEGIKYYYDDQEDVCVSVTTNSGYTHYARVLDVYVTRAPVKINRLNNFIYRHCTPSPTVYPNDVSPKQGRETMGVSTNWAIINSKDY